MATIEVKVPQLSESVSEASLLQWHKQEGDVVELDENLIDIETDKVVLELPTPQAGVLQNIIKGNGAHVISGEVIAIINTEMPAVAVEESATEEDAPIVDMEENTPEAPVEPVPMPEPTPIETPVAKPSTVVSIPPVTAMTVAPPKASTTHTPPPTSSGSAKWDQSHRHEDRVPMSRLRARIAERLLHSQQTTATLTTFNEINMQPVISLRQKYKEKFETEHGVRLGFMSFFVKAAVAALKKYPIINTSIDGTDIVYHGYFDIGIAISSPRGLVVPVLRDADQMSIADIERKINEFNIQARDGHLTLEDLSGGTFSISNGGVFGSLLSTPIINPPQSAILGVHATQDRPVVENGEIVIRPMNNLALSYDHRLIDGRDAVLALVAMKEAMEDPARLLLDI